MASRRMFSKDVVCSDRFLDMPASAQALYFQYGLEADDDGFVSAPKKILRLTNASDDDLKILVAKGFLIPFDSGVVVIRDWKINNYLRRDRYTPTRFKEEFEQLDTIDDRYQLHVLAVGIPDDNHVVDMRDTQVRLGKDSIGKGIFHLSMILTNSQLRIRLPKHHPVTADRVVAVSILAKCLRMSR